MIDSKLVTGTLKTIVTVFLVGGVWLWSMGIKADTVSSPKYATQQSQGIMAENGAEWSDGIDEQTTYSGLEFKIDQPSEQYTESIFASYSGSVVQLSDFLGLDWEIHAASQDWLNLNRGDGSKDLIRIVIFRF